MPMLQTKEKQNPKKIEDHYSTLKNSLPNIGQKKYFLICESCLWMASTIPSIKEISRLLYNKCPLCESRLNRFLICEETF
ncbi:MAG: hypothetical protein ACTHJ7_03070 [Candidatus Nitrosocosmicus sp.]